MIVDWTLDLGTLMTILVIVGGGIMAYAKVSADQKGVTRRLSAVEGGINELTRFLEKVSVQKSRLDDHAARLDRIERQIDSGHLEGLAP